MCVWGGGGGGKVYIVTELYYNGIYLVDHIMQMNNTVHYEYHKQMVGNRLGQFLLQQETPTTIITTSSYY